MSPAIPRKTSERVMPETYKLFVPLVPPSANVLRRKYRHWAAYGKLRDEWQRLIYYTLCQQDRTSLQMLALGNRRSVSIHIVHKRQFDPDNAHAACKPILDSMVRCGIIHDDSAKYIELTVTQGDSRTEPEGTTITLGHYSLK